MSDFKTTFIFVLILWLCMFANTSCNKTVGNTPYWVIEDSLRQLEQDSIINELNNKRLKADSLMRNDICVVGDIKLGQTKREYEKIIKQMKSEIGYDGVGFDDMKLLICDEKFYKGKLYSVTLRHSYLYPEYRAEYNSSPYYNPEPYIKPIISHFENKYGRADCNEEHEDEIRGHEVAVEIRKVWTFPKKRITITNKAAQYGGGTEHADYELQIVIDSPGLADEIEQKERLKAQEKERKVREKEKALETKRQNLFNTL